MLTNNNDTVFNSETIFHWFRDQDYTGVSATLKYDVLSSVSTTVSAAAAAAFFLLSILPLRHIQPRIAIKHSTITDGTMISFVNENCVTLLCDHIELFPIVSW